MPMPDIEPMRCRLCGADDLRLFYTQGEDGRYRFYRCRNCGLVNLDLSTGLDQRKYRDPHPPGSSSSKRRSAMMERSWRFLAKHLSGMRGGSILEVGCGDGSFLEPALAEGWKVAGIELLQELAERASGRLGITVEACDFQDYRPRAGEDWDLVVMRHVLEHIPDCKGSIAKCASMLAPGGILYLELPNIDGLSFRLKRTAGRLGLRKPRYRPGYVPGHCNEYCRSSLRWLAETAGLEMIHWSTYSSKRWMDQFYRLFPVATKARALLARPGERPGRRVT